MTGFIDDGYEAYVEAIAEQLMTQASQLEGAAGAAADAEQATALRWQALELRAELERRLRNAEFAFF